MIKPYDIPPRYSLTGDRDKAAKFLSRSRKELGFLDEQLAFNKTDQGVRGPVVISEDGVTVTCRRVFNESFIEIHAPEKKVKKGYYDNVCLCNCNFSLGIVARKQEERINDSVLYTVLACNYKTGFILYKNILASDWAEYTPGQKVILIPYLLMDWKCCPDPILNYGAIRGYGCRAARSENEITDEGWRTSYRIIPYMARLIPKEVQIRSGNLQ